MSLGFISDKIIKEKLFKKEITADDLMDLKYGVQRFILNMFHYLFFKMSSEVSACKKCVLHRPKNDGK